MPKTYTESVKLKKAFEFSFPFLKISALDPVVCLGVGILLVGVVMCNDMLLLTGAQGPELSLCQI